MTNQNLIIKIKNVDAISDMGQRFKSYDLMNISQVLSRKS